MVQVGQKAFYLGQLLQKGHPVVPGVVIPAKIFQAFLTQVDWSEPLFEDLPNSSLRLNIEDWQQLQAIAQHLRRAILATPFPVELSQALIEIIHCWQPSPLIVRPSLGLAAKHANQAKATLEPLVRTSALMTSQLCALEPVELEQAIQHLWADFFGARSLFYWQRLEIPLHQVQFSTLLQPIPAAIAAGTVQCVDDHLEIQATPGLGMAIARGEVTPDRYYVSTNGTLISKHLGRRTIAYRQSPLVNAAPHLQSLQSADQKAFVLDETLIRDLAQIAQRVMAFTAPIELEWVLHNLNDTPTFEFTQVIPLNTPSPSQSWLGVGMDSTSLPSHSHLLSKPPQRDVSIPTLGGEAVLVASGAIASPGQAIAPAWVLQVSDDLPSELPTGAIIVTTTLPLEWLPLLQQAAGIVMEQGSATSHSAIVARELGIPAVVGALVATTAIQPGDSLWIDGDRAQIYRVPPSLKTIPTTFTDGTRIQNPVQLSDRSATVHPITTQLMVNVSCLKHLESLATLPIDGIGLVRSELLLPTILGTEHPLTWLQHHNSQELIQGLTKRLLPLTQIINPRPVFYRSLDLRPQEFRPLAASASLNIPPEWGLRGTRSYQVNPALFDLELEALAQMQQAGATNLCLLLPFVRTVEEFEFCQQRVKRAGLTQYPNFQLWIMAEVPSILFLLPEYVEAGVQGISLGSNDLTQLLFGLDRNQPDAAAPIDERHPAVKRAIAQLIRQSKENKIPCSICGEAPVRHPELILDLIRWGITTISVAPEAVETTYHAIAHAEQVLRS
jgi:pyruvate,water dikinase